MLVVNLFGAPGAGKSTGAAYLFALLKMNGYNAELVTEFIKDKIWEQNTAVFQNQAYIFGKQSFKLSRLTSGVDIAVTDAPLLHSAYYGTGDSFRDAVMTEFDKYQNVNFFVERCKEYNPAGRFQTEEGADAVGAEIRGFLDKYRVNYYTIKGDRAGYDRALEIVASTYVHSRV